jgi:hypothetical protein
VRDESTKLMTDRDLGAALAMARKHVELAAAMLRQRAREHKQSVEAAELGRHGQADVIAGRRAELDAVEEALELLASADDDLEQAAAVTGTLASGA